MSLIKNLIKEPEIKNRPHHKKKKNESGVDKHGVGDNGEDNDECNSSSSTQRPIIKTATDLQRLKIEKLMKNPDKPIHIPEARQEKDYLQSVPTFVRNVMGSSAGAGSGEFHVYRHLRRKEYARQKMIQIKSHKERMDDDFQKKLEDNKKAAEEKTAKKRAKRLKKKQRKKVRKDNPSRANNPEHSQEDSSSEEDKEEEQADGDSGKGNEDATEQSNHDQIAPPKSLEADESASSGDAIESEPTTEHPSEPVEELLTD